MPIQPVISNTTPLIGLSGLNCLPLLQDLYTEVWIPREVEKEFLALDKTIYQEVLNSAPWIKVIDLTNPQSRGQVTLLLKIREIREIRENPRFRQWRGFVENEL
ncbi:hypothetical protein F4009_24180 [Candidatus Poribacteria bacterium]|nr:hypothetical protein [Candidatus Poribacteria bacterium]MYH79536.1 hypothetical protein [Candidatus Poribacteria bacterium]MYK97057.1 hypothetical protein [Candidatus Poribacteria bacterium]